MATATLSTSELRRAAGGWGRLAVAIAVIAGLLVGLLAGAMGGSGVVLAVVLIAALVVPIVWWRFPASGVITLCACATLIEQFPYPVGIPGLDAFTDRIPIFTSLDGALNVTGLVMTPMDVMVIVLLLVWLTRGVTQRNLRVPRSQVAATLGLLILLAMIALIRGLIGPSTEGDGISGTTAALWEVRPWVYLGVAYLFASQAIRSRSAVQAVLWTFILGSGFKAFQGIYIFLRTSGLNPAPEAILAHEESLLFSIFMLITICLWIYRQRGPLRTIATCLLPFVVFADIANTRRDAVLIGGLELIVLFILVYVGRPERRTLLLRSAAVAVLALALYLPLEWNGTGTLASVATAIRSGIAPNTRDLESDAYRIDEDADLGNMIRQNLIVGTGFGVPIVYEYTPVADISSTDTIIAYVPHNTLLYVWMRTGILGEAGLWMLLAAVFLSGAQVSRSGDPEVAMIGTVAACTTAGWLVMGYTDMGFWWFRLALALGILLGVLQAVSDRERWPSTSPRVGAGRSPGTPGA